MVGSLLGRLHAFEGDVRRLKDAVGRFESPRGRMVLSVQNAVVVFRPHLVGYRKTGPILYPFSYRMHLNINLKMDLFEMMVSTYFHYDLSN